MLHRLAAPHTHPRPTETPHLAIGRGEGSFVTLSAAQDAGKLISGQGLREDIPDYPRSATTSGTLPRRSIDPPHQRPLADLPDAASCGTSRQASTATP